MYCALAGAGRHHKRQVSHDERRREEPMLKISMLGVSTSSHVIGLSMDLGMISNMFENLKLEAWSAEDLGTYDLLT